MAWVEQGAADEVGHDCGASTDEIDAILRRLARREALCRRILGRLARNFLRRQAHTALGFVRLDDYARERLGLSGRELQELGRVARKLEQLPLLRQAFEEGILSWSHVRLLVGVATPETEAGWLERARSETVRGLDAAIADERGRVADPDEELTDGEPRTRLRLRCPRSVRRSWRHACELASRMSGARLAVWQAAEVIAAEGLSGADADPEATVAAAPPATSLERSSAPVTPPGWEAVVGVLPVDIDAPEWDVEYLEPFALDTRLRAAVRALQSVDFQTGRLLRLVADRRLHHAFGFQSIRDYVRERLGFSLRKARALLALDRRLADLPALADAYREGRLSLARALALLPVIHPSTERDWLARAGEVTIRRLADIVEWACEIAEPDRPVLPPPAEGPLTLPPVQMCARDCDATIRFDGPLSVIALLRSAIRAFTPRGAPAWQGLERLLQHVIGEWESRPRHRDPIFERDGWRCAVPVCSARSSLQDHHVIHRSAGGENGRYNRVAICVAHHLRGIHGMRIRVHGVAPHDLTWEIGCRRGFPPLMRTHGDRYLEVA